MKDNHTPEQSSSTHVSMSAEDLLAAVMCEAWRSPTEFDLQLTISLIQMVSFGMSEAEISKAAARAFAFIHASEN